MVILLKPNKSLLITKYSKFYQKENIVDSLLFLLPLTYNDLELKNFTWVMSYIDQKNTAHSEILEMVMDISDNPVLYNEAFLEYQIPVDSELTQYTGDIELKLTGTWNDTSEEKNYVFHSGTVTITISPLSDMYAFVEDDTLDAIDQKLLIMNGQIQAIQAVADRIEDETPDDLTLTDNTLLQLSVNGEPIGEGITIPDFSYDLDGDDDGLVDIDNTSEDPGTEPTSVPIIDL